MIRSGNPTLNSSVFAQSRTYGLNDSMTVQGTVNKCFILLFLLLIGAGWVWSKVQFSTTPLVGSSAYAPANPLAPVMPYVWIGGLGGFILAMITVFNRSAARFTAPLYALCEGLALGGISAIFEMSYPGIVIQAVGLTFAVMFCMLAIYRSGIIKVDNKFILGVTAATGAIMLFYFVSMILGFFHISVPILYSSGVFGIGFSLLVVGVAAFNLIVDFYVIEEGARLGADKNMEWYGAFALMVTLVWLYMEILRLLAKLRDRR